MRIEVVRDEGDGEIVYRGQAKTEAAAFALQVVATREAATATVLDTSVSSELKAKLEKLAAALVRAATRAELTSGREPPRKIVRWREL